MRLRVGLRLRLRVGLRLRVRIGVRVRLGPYPPSLHLGEAEDVVDEEQHVLALRVAEVPVGSGSGSGSTFRGRVWVRVRVRVRAGVRVRVRVKVELSRKYSAIVSAVSATRARAVGIAMKRVQKTRFLF